MISLTAKQARIAHIIIVAQARGMKLTLVQVATLAGLARPSSALRHVVAIRERIGAGTLESIVPRGPHGERLRFIPFGSAE
jgi:hypothetical protein